MEESTTPSPNRKSTIGWKSDTPFFDLACGVLFLSLALWILLATPSSTGDGIATDPYFFPRGLAWLTVMVSIVLGLRGFWTIKMHRVESTDTNQSTHIQRTLLSLGLLILYAFLIDWLAFTLTTVFFLVALMFTLGERRLVVMIFVPIGVTFILGFLFGAILNVPLPERFYTLIYDVLFSSSV